MTMRRRLFLSVVLTLAICASFSLLVYWMLLHATGASEAYMIAVSAPPLGVLLGLTVGGLASLWCWRPESDG